MKYTKQEKMSERATKTWFDLLKCRFALENNICFERENVVKVLEEAANTIRIQELTIQIQELKMKNITLRPGEHSISKGKYVSACCQETKEEDCERCDVGEERCESEKIWEEVLLLNLLKYICEHSKKNGVDDLYKAKDYLEKLIHENLEVDKK